MENLDFSVVVCCYNSSLEKLKKTIVSIEKQKEVSFEIIVSDDGSADRSVEQIKPWAEQNGFNNIKYNFLKENVGTVKNILSAAKLSQANHIKSISPGDYFFDEFSLKKYLQKFQEGDYKLIFSKAVYYTDEGKILKHYNPRATGTTHKLFMKKNLCEFADSFLGATVAWQKDMIKYFEQMAGVVRLMEDYPLTLLALMNNEKVGFINQNLIWYECNTGVSTTNGGKLLDKDYENFYAYLAQKYPSKKTSKNIQFLKLLRGKKTFKKIVKLLCLKPSYLFYVLDVKLTNLFRKIKFTFKKLNLTKMHEFVKL